MLRISQQNKESSRLCLHVIIQITDQRMSDSAIGHAAIMAIDRLLDVLKEEKEKKRKQEEREKLQKEKKEKK